MSACASGPPRPPGAVAVEIRSGSLPAGPPPPGRGLPMPSLDVEWSPPMLVAGDVGALARALAEHEVVALRGGPRWGAAIDADPLQPVLETIAPQVSIAAVTTGPAANLLDEPSLPVVRIERDDGEPPHYQHGGIVLAPDWNEGREVTGDAPAVLVIDEAPVDLDVWRHLPARSLGGCGAALDALAAGQEQSLASLETFLDHADAVLRRLYRSELEVLLPVFEDELQARIGQVGATNDADAGRRRCVDAHAERMAREAACLRDPSRCTTAPRVFLVGGARIGIPEPDAAMPSACAEWLGRDVAAELEWAAHDAARAAVERFDASWTALADRLGTITEVHAALEDICTPRRRRFAADDLEAARDRLARIGEALASEELERPGASWRFDALGGSTIERFHVPGVGRLRQLARYDGGEGSPSRRVLAESRGLRQFVLDRALCGMRDDARPLVAMLVRADARTPAFLGYFFDEELSCADLGPR